MSKTTAQDFLALLNGAFADVLGFTKDDWADIEDVAQQMRDAGTFKADPIKCTVSAFILWFEQLGYLEDDRIPDHGHH